MNENIKRSIKQAEEIVKASEVSNEFTASAYEVVLAYLLQTNNALDRQSITDNESTNQPPRSVNQSSDWRSLVKQKNPANLYQLIALVVDYIQKQKPNDQQEDPLVSMEEIKTFLEKECVDRIEYKDFEKLNIRIKDTVSSYKYIESKKRGFYVLSPLGRKMISRLPEKP